jgi:hypothetical protein
VFEISTSRTKNPQGPGQMMEWYLQFELCEECFILSTSAIVRFPTPGQPLIQMIGSGLGFDGAGTVFVGVGTAFVGGMLLIGVGVASI